MMVTIMLIASSVGESYTAVTAAKEGMCISFVYLLLCLMLVPSL